VTVLCTLAPGKVNLCLFVGVPRADGLHPLVSVVQPVTLADEVCLEPAPPGATTDEVVCAGVRGENLAARALAAYREASGWDAPPQRLTIRKRVPVAAGMGGGSADAAAALRLAAHAAGRPGDPLLAALAPALGADVPAQVTPARALVTGAGEHVEALPPATPAAGGLLILPAATAELATAAVYREADRLGSPRDAAGLAALERQVRAAAGARDALPDELALNDLEPAARELCPAIEGALAAARAAGADRAMVSGSGPTVFAVFAGPDGPHRAGEAAAALAGSYPRAVAAAPAGSGLGAIVTAGRAAAPAVAAGRPRR
jgi:4-diphosphocytidyl-2-C-methyl-D-erythritol kinase